MLVQAKDGRLFRVPDGTPEDEIRERLALVERTAPVQQEEQGIMGRAGDLLVQGGRELFGAGAEGLATLSDLAFDDTTDAFESTLQDFAQSQRDKRSEIRGIKPLQEAEGIGDVLSSAASYLTQSVPEMGSIFAGAGVGAKVGTAFGPLGTLIGGLTGGALVGIVPFLGRNTDEFVQVQGRRPTREEALTLLGTSVVQSGLNVLITRLLPLKGQTLTAAMVKRAFGGTGLESFTEGLQDTLQVLAANDFDPEALRDPEVQYRLTESFLAGAAVGGGLGLASGPFGVERPTPVDNRELEQAARDFTAGRPPAEQTQGPALLPAPDARLPIEDQRPDAPLQITAQDTPPSDSRVEIIPRVPRGERTERTFVDSDGRTQTVVSTPSVGQAEAEVRTMTGQQEPFLVGEPDTPPLSPDQQAAQTSNDMVQQIYREALDAGRDPLADLSNPEITRRIDDAIAGEMEQDVVLAQTPLAQEAQNVSRLKNKELIEWAKENAGRNENLDNIVNSDIRVTKKAQLIRELLREMNVGRTTAAEMNQQVGDPILRKAADVDEDGRITRTTAEGTVEATDPAAQARMSRRTDTEQGLAVREEVGPIVTPALREMLRLRGGEASVRIDADGSRQITEVPGQSPGAGRYEGALNYLTVRLQDLATKGEQGKKVAQAVKQQVMDDTTMDANAIVSAFLAADAVVETLGGRGPDAGVDINFLKALTNEEGKSLNGLKSYKPTANGKMQAVINLALDQSPDRVQQTASHEAFHVLQDFFAEYSPKDAKLLDSVYKLKDGKVNYRALPASIRKLWKKRAPDLHRRALNGDLPVMDSPSEFQAMTFEFYRAAQQAGDTAPLTGAFGNFFDFVTRFLPRLRNSLRGMGFQTAEDVFTRAGRGDTAAQVEGRAISPRQDAAPTEESRVIPVRESNRGLQGRFGITNPARGGNYIQVDDDFNVTGDLTGKTYTGAIISISPEGRPDMQVSDVETVLGKQDMFPKDGKKYGHVVNLINPNQFTKRRSQWKWVDRDNDTDPIHTLVSVTSTNNLSVENGGPTSTRSKLPDGRIKNPSGDHLFALSVNMNGPAKLSTFPDSPDEPRLRPVTYAEDVVKGNIVGRIDLRGKEHPVYDNITLKRREDSDSVLNALDEQGAEESIRLTAESVYNDVEIIEGTGEYFASRIPITTTTRLTRDSTIYAYFLEDDAAENLNYRVMLEAYSGRAPQVVEALDNLEIGVGGENGKVLFDSIRRNREFRRLGAAAMAEEWARAVGSAARGYGVNGTSSDAPQILVFEYPQKDTGESPSMSIMIFPDDTVSEPYTDNEMVNAYRVENEVFDFFPDIKNFKVEDKTSVRAYARLLSIDYPQRLKNAGLDETKQYWELGFSVDGDYTTQNDKDVRTALEVFGKATASIRNILDTIVGNGGTVDGVVFSGTDEKKQKLYEKMVANKSFRSLFPEFGEAQGIRYKGDRASAIDVKSKFKQDDIVDAIFEDTETGELTDAAGRPVPDPRQLDLFDEASIRLDRVQDLSQMDLNPANDRVSSLFGLTEAMRRLSSLDILYNPQFNPALPEKDEKAGRDGKKRDKGRNVSEAARMLHNRALAVLNEPITGPNPETDEIIARTMAAEIVAARENNPDTNATDWYTQSVQAAIQAVAQIHPEVATDPEHRSAFSLALALTSQGIVVDRNSRLGLRAYEFWRDNGRFPEFGEGQAGEAIKKNFQNANILLDTFNRGRFNEAFYDFLDTQYTVRELKQRLESYGIKTGRGGVSLTGENQDTIVYGSFMFGPKIGQGFYQNLMGNFDPVTIDLWFMRTWGRMTGTLIGNESAYQKNLNELRTSMRNEGMEFDEELFGTDEQYTFDKITEANQVGEDFYKANKEAIDNKDMEKTPMMKAAKMALVNGVKPKGTPRGGNERLWMRSVVKRAQDILAEQGINLTSADMQAILWYPEKDLYAKLTSGGLEERLNQSYEDSFKEIVDGETGLRTVDGGGRRADPTRESINKADEKSRRGTSQPVSGQEESIRFSQPDYLTTDGMKAVIAPPNTDGVISGVANFVKRFTTGAGRSGLKRQFIDEFIHGLAPIARRELELSNRTRGERRYLPFQQGAFKALEFAQQSSGRIQMIMTKGAPKLNPDGSVGILEGTRGLLDIFQPIGAKEKYAKFQMFVYAQRAQRLKNEGRENLMTDAQIAEGMRYGAENPEFQEVFNQYKNFNEGLMQFLEDTGSITEETKKKLIGTADYVPFYRVIDEEQYTEGFMGQIKRPSDVAHNGTSAFDNPDAMIKRVVQRLKGGEEKIGDLYENIFKNTEAIVSSGMRNEATRRVVKMIKDLKKTGFYDGMEAPSDISASEAGGNNNHFTYREDGKTKYFDVGQDGELITALRSFTPTQTQGLFKTMQDIGRFFRNAITITPSFMIANLIRGDMAGVVSVDAPLRPMIDTVTGLKNALKDTETIQEMKTIAGFGGYNFGESSTDFAKKMKRHYRRHEGYDIVDTPQKLTDMFGHFFDKIGAVGEATELATREAIFRRLTDGGTNPADAAYEALNLINYSRRGNPQSLPAQAFASLIPLVPFLNARVQGLYRTATAFGPEANAKHTALKGLGLFAASMGVYAVMSQEDDWEQEPLYRKLNYYIIYAGDRKFLIPKPFEIGAVFSTIPEVFLDGIRQKDGEYVQKAVTEILLNNFSFNPIPQAVKPLVEVATNYDFFRGRDIESLGVRGLPTEMRAYSTTTEFAKTIGQITAALGISPIEAEALVNGYTGSMGSMILGGLDTIMELSGTIPNKPSGIFGDTIESVPARALGLTRFVKDRAADPANRYLSEFYELKREADEVVRGINRLREEGNYEEAMELRRENRSLIGVKKQLNKKYVQLNELNDQISGVKQSGATADEKKRRLDALIKRRNRIVSDMARLKSRIRG